MEQRDQELRGSLVPPTEAERDRRELLSTVTRLKDSMREALTYLRSDESKGERIVAAIEALKYGLEQM
jgi:hypothetical protein